MRNFNSFSHIVAPLFFIFAAACSNNEEKNSDPEIFIGDARYDTLKVFSVNSELAVFHSKELYFRRYGCYSEFPVDSLLSVEPEYVGTLSAGVLDLKVKAIKHYIREDSKDLCVDPNPEDFNYSFYSRYFVNFIDNSWLADKGTINKIKYSNSGAIFEVTPEDNDDYIQFGTDYEHKCFASGELNEKLCFIDELKDFPSLALTFWGQCKITGPDTVCPAVMPGAYIRIRKNVLTEALKTELESLGWTHYTY